MQLSNYEFALSVRKKSNDLQNVPITRVQNRQHCRCYIIPYFQPPNSWKCAWYFFLLQSNNSGSNGQTVVGGQQVILNHPSSASDVLPMTADSNITQPSPAVPPPPASVVKPPTKTIIDANGIKARKPCNCNKSQCLKLWVYWSNGSMDQYWMFTLIKN